MPHKRINIQYYIFVPDSYVFLAKNRSGELVGFINPPIRDYKLGMWQDSVTGSYGDIIDYADWDTSVRKFADYNDFTENNLGKRMRQKNALADPGTPKTNPKKGRKSL